MTSSQSSNFFFISSNLLFFLRFLISWRFVLKLLRNFKSKLSNIIYINITNSTKIPVYSRVPVGVPAKALPGNPSFCKVITSCWGRLSWPADAMEYVEAAWDWASLTLIQFVFLRPGLGPVKKKNLNLVRVREMNRKILIYKFLFPI